MKYVSVLMTCGFSTVKRAVNRKIWVTPDMGGIWLAAAPETLKLIFIKASPGHKMEGRTRTQDGRPK